ncbi:MAG TPA: DUF899 family protein [Afifellaceae bacterium]|nr:DUF899 family protein [Afifellaceae bacterium]
MHSLHDRRFPGEDKAYRDARDTLLAAELALEDQLREVVAMRQALPASGKVAEDYEFATIGNGGERTIRLSELFEPGKDSLFLYSFMFGPDDERPCPACTSLIDGFDGIRKHIENRMNIAVVAKSPIGRIAEFAESRGWNGIRLLSSAANSYNTDYFAETPDGRQIPAANIFVRRNGDIRHFYSTEMLYVDQPGRHPRHVDRIWPIWNIFDLTPEGRGDWGPKLTY